MGREDGVDERSERIERERDDRARRRRQRRQKGRGRSRHGKGGYRPLEENLRRMLTAHIIAIRAIKRDSCFSEFGQNSCNYEGYLKGEIW